MVKAVLLVPAADNDGQLFLDAHWWALEAKLLDFGGFTRGGDVAGAWKAQGRVFRDESRQYIVALQSWRDLPAWLVVVEWARERFRQEAMFVEVAGVPEILGPAE